MTITRHHPVPRGAVSKRPKAPGVVVPRVVVTLLLVALLGCAARPLNVGGPASEDARVRAAVVDELQEIDELTLDDLVIEVAAGVVTLSGFQTSLEPLAAALRRAASVSGVKEIVNRVRIVRGPEAAG